jgi:superfamily I DNA/RNA helicase
VQDQLDAAFERELINWLSFHEGMLVGELVPYALRYLRENPASPERDMYDYVIVDEYQDLNRAEQVLIDIISENSSISIVGDVDQSIYSFKHAHPEGILEYSQTHDETHDEVLTECRRCPKSVVTIADSLIKENHDSTDTRLYFHDQNPEGDVKIVQFNSIFEESEGLSELINHLVDNEGYEPGEILVLTPRRLIAYQIRDNLNDLEIPVHSYYQEEALEDAEAQLAFNKLSLLVERDNKIALRYWLGFGSNTWNRHPYSYIMEYCNENGDTPFGALEKLENGEIDIPYSGALLVKFIKIKEELDTLDGLSVEDILNTLFPPQAEWAEQLRSLAMEVFQEEITLQKFLNELTTKITQPLMPEEGDYVRIMSLHKSKGLSSPVVIIAGCVEGLIPMIKGDLTPQERENTLKEQRRLFYVAMTRTRERLIISGFRNIDRALSYRIGALVRGRNTITSRFIRELGPTAPDVLNGDIWRRNGFN